MDERHALDQLRASLQTIKPIVTMSRDGLVLTALEWDVARAPAYETVTAATQAGHLVQISPWLIHDITTGKRKIVNQCVFRMIKCGPGS